MAKKYDRTNRSVEADPVALVLGTDVYTQEILDRLYNLEEEVFKSGGRTTVVRQLLVLKHSGLLDVILGWKLMKKDLLNILGLLLNRHPDSIKDYVNSLQKDRWMIENGNNSDILELLDKLEILKVQ